MKKAIIMAGSAVLVAGSIIGATLRHAPSLNEIIATPTITATATYTPTPTATSTPTSTPTPEFSASFLALRDDLVNRINDYNNQGIDVAIAVTDLSNMQSIDVNGNVLMQPGCTGNTYAMLMLMEEVQNGNIDYASIETAVREGVAYSHPWKFRDVFAQEYGSVEVGIAKTQQYMVNHGFPGTYDHIPASGSESGILNEMTANGINDAFVRLYRGELFNPEITEETKSIFRDGIPGYLLYMLPENIQGRYEWMMRKLGTFDDSDGKPEIDCGIIKPYNHEPYSICVFTAGGANTMGTRGEGALVIAKLSEVVMDYFGK